MEIGNFLVTQILLEINFGECKSSKMPFQPLEHANINEKTNSEFSNLFKNSCFWTSQISDIDFTENLNGSKCLKFPLCKDSES